MRAGIPCDDVSLISRDISTNTGICVYNSSTTHRSGSIVYRYPTGPYIPVATLACHTWHSRTVCIDGEGGVGTHSCIFTVLHEISNCSIFISKVFPPISYKVYLRGICKAIVKSRYQSRKSGVQSMCKDMVME